MQNSKYLRLENSREPPEWDCHSSSHYVVVRSRSRLFIPIGIICVSDFPLEEAIRLFLLPRFHFRGACPEEFVEILTFDHHQTIVWLSCRL